MISSLHMCITAVGSALTFKIEVPASLTRHLSIALNLPSLAFITVVETVRNLLCNVDIRA